MPDQEETTGTEAEEDTELHLRRRTAMATDEKADESESDDDVELHGKRRSM